MNQNNESKLINALITDLTCDNVIKCQNARHELVVLGPAVVEPLSKALKSRKQMVRWEAAKALGQIGGPEAMTVLVKTLRDRSFDLRWLAAEGLTAMGREAVVPLLRELTRHPNSIWLQQGVHRILHNMKRGELDSLLKPVIKALEGAHPSLEVPLAAKVALDKIADIERS